MRGYKNIFHANRNKKKARVAVLISDQTGFKTECNKRQRSLLHNGKDINPTIRYNIGKYLCT